MNGSMPAISSPASSRIGLGEMGREQRSATIFERETARARVVSHAAARRRGGAAVGHLCLCHGMHAFAHSGLPTTRTGSTRCLVCCYVLLPPSPDIALARLSAGWCARVSPAMRNRFLALVVCTYAVVWAFWATLWLLPATTMMTMRMRGLVGMYVLVAWVGGDKGSVAHLALFWSRPWADYGGASLGFFFLGCCS